MQKEVKEYIIKNLPFKPPFKQAIETGQRNPWGRSWNIDAYEKTQQGMQPTAKAAADFIVIYCAHDWSLLQFVCI